MHWDRVGLFYFIFLGFCLVNLLVGGFFVSERTFLTMFHVYGRLVEGFLIYLLSFNAIKTEHQVGIVSHLSIGVLLLTSGYFIWENLYVMDLIQMGGTSGDGSFQSFYTTQLKVIRGELGMLPGEGSAMMNRLWSWIGGPNGRAAFSLILCSFALGFFNMKKSLFGQPFIVCAMLLGGISIILQISISAIGIGGLVVLAYIYKSRGLLLNHQSVCMKITCFIILGVCLILLNPLLLNKISVYLESGGSSAHRANVVGEALDAAAKTGFMGNGFDSVARASEWYEDYGTLGFLNTHNTYLEILLDAGLPGLIAFVAVLIFTYKNAVWLENNGSGKKSRQFGIACQLMLIGMAMSFLTSHGQLKNVTFFGVFWILMGCCNRLKLNQEENSIDVQSQRTFYNTSNFQGSAQVT